MNILKSVRGFEKYIDYKFEQVLNIEVLPRIHHLLRLNEYYFVF